VQRLPERTKQKLERLHKRRLRLEASCTKAADDLCVAVFQASERRVTRKEIAELLGVGTSTVQGWVERGKRASAKKEV
jgi:DNA-directed RNA polymerase specialized sigma24 family protein